MATTRISDKLSKIVSSQIPEFIRSENPKFIAFIEAYYRFLEQDQGSFELLQNSRSYNDLDRTVDSFVKYFIDTYAPSLPEGVLANKPLLVKRIKDLYEAKGSELSFKLLFNTFFNSDVTVSYPFENVLRASDGKWEQKFSLRIRTTEGDINDIQNRYLRHEAGGLQYNTPIQAIKPLSPNETEVFLDQNFLSSSYSVGDYVEVLDFFSTATITESVAEDGILFKGIITATPTSYSISRPGVGFKVGQVFSINLSGGVGTLVKVSNVSTSGGILDLKIINYGFNYPFVDGIFTIQLDPTKKVSELSDLFVTSEKMNGFSDSGQIVSFSDTSENRYFEGDYVDYDELIYTYSSILASFGDSTFNISPLTTTFEYNNDLASIVFRPGALGVYPGSYIKNDSFLSEAEVRLEDSTIYQPFAYLTNTSLDIDVFYDLIMQTVHPAGQILYNNRIISDTISLANVVYVTPQSNNLGWEALSTFDVYDDYSSELRKTINEIQTISEDISLVRIKPVRDSQTVADNTTVNVEKEFNEFVSFSEVFSITFPNKPAINDVLNITEVISLNLNRPINNTDAVVSFTDNGNIIRFDETTFYFSSSYVNDDYVTGIEEERDLITT